MIGCFALKKELLVVTLPERVLEAIKGELARGLDNEHESGRGYVSTGDSDRTQ